MMTEDLDAFLDTDDFAVAATVGASTVNGVFDNGHAEVLEHYAGTKPTFLCTEDSLPALTLGVSTIVISSTTYLIVGRMPDGFGLVTLVLEAGS